MLLADGRVVVTNESILYADDYPEALDELLVAACPRFGPRVIGNNIKCRPRESGHFRNKLDGFEVEASFD